MNEEIILPSDDRAAKLTTVTGWVSRAGHFYGNDERTARYDGSTHNKCETCGAVANKGWLSCAACSNKKRHEKYLEIPFKEWDGTTPLCLHHDDKYFFSEDDLIEFIEENEDENYTGEDLELMICEPNYASEIDADDMYQDILPEDQSLDDRYPELAAKIEEVNQFIREEKKAISWNEGRWRTEYKYKRELEA